MIEIAKAVRACKASGTAFDVQFISEGELLEQLLIGAGFPVENLEPRISPSQIERA